MQTRNSYWLMRHGQSENNILNLSNTHAYDLYPLTELGRKQSRRAAEELRSEGIDCIYASPFLRTRKTAEIVASALGLSIIYSADLVELREQAPDSTPIGTGHLGWESTQGDEESYRQLYIRIKNFIKQVESENSGKHILIVTHGSPQNMLEAVLLTESEEGAQAMMTAIQASAMPYKKNAVAYRILSGV